MSDSNRPPAAYKTAALPDELIRHYPDLFELSCRGDNGPGSGIPTHDLSVPNRAL